MGAPGQGSQGLGLEVGFRVRARVWVRVRVWG